MTGRALPTRGGTPWGRRPQRCRSRSPASRKPPASTVSSSGPIECRGSPRCRQPEDRRAWSTAALDPRGGTSYPVAPSTPPPASHRGISQTQENSHFFLFIFLFFCRKWCSWRNQSYPVHQASSVLAIRRPSTDDFQQNNSEGECVLLGTAVPSIKGIRKTMESPAIEDITRAPLWSREHRFPAFNVRQLQGHPEE